MRAPALLCMLALASAATVGVAEEEGRRVVATEAPGGTVIRYDVNAGECVLVAKLQGLDADAEPWSGLAYTEITERMGLDFAVKVRTPTIADGQWKISWGSCKSPEQASLAGRDVASVEGEQPMPIVSTRMPLELDGVELYVITYRVVESRTDAVLVAISEDKEYIRDAVNLAPSRDFEWAKSFQTTAIPDGVTDPGPQEPKEEDKPPFMSMDMDARPLEIQCCWNMLETCRAIASDFNQQHGAILVRIMPRESYLLADDLVEEKLWGGIVEEGLTPYTRVKLVGKVEDYALGHLIIRVAVNSQNRIQEMDLAELADVYRGRTTEWKALINAPNAGIIAPYGNKPHSLINHLFRSSVLHGGPLVPEFYDETVDPPRGKKTGNEVMAAVIENRDAIGFFRCDCSAEYDKRIRTLRLATKEDSPAVGPTVASVAERKYPLTDTFTFYLHPEAPDLVREYCEFARSAEAADAIKSSSIWPEYYLERYRGEQRVLAAQAGEGPEVLAVNLAGRTDILDDVSLEFIRATMPIQLKQQSSRSVDGAVLGLSKGDIDVLFDGGAIAQYQRTGNGREDTRIKKCRYVELGRTAVGIVVHPNNPLRELTLDQVSAIFCRRVTKWPTVRGDSPTIHVMGLKYNDPMSLLLREKLQERGPAKIGSYKMLEDSSEVLAAVAEDPAAIGFVNLRDLSPDDSSVRLVPLRGPGDKKVVSATEDESKGAPKKGVTSGMGFSPTLADFGLGADYPLARTYSIYISPKAKAPAESLGEFATTKACGKFREKYQLLKE